MADKYIHFLTFFIPGVLLLIGGFIYKPPKEDIEKYNITKLRLYSAGFLSLSIAIMALIFD